MIHSGQTACIYKDSTSELSHIKSAIDLLKSNNIEWIEKPVKDLTNVAFSDVIERSTIIIADKSDFQRCLLKNQKDSFDAVLDLAENQNIPLLDSKCIDIAKSEENFRKLVLHAYKITQELADTTEETIQDWSKAHTETSTFNLPEDLTIKLRNLDILRYGENPHQSAGFYKLNDTRPGISTAKQLQGKKLSYNNINDTDAAFELVSEFHSNKSPAVAIIKHANPCGVAMGENLKDAYQKALACDPISAFGGIIALNQMLDAEAATDIVDIFTEVIIAPSATKEAQEIIASKKNLRLLVTGGMPDPREKRWLLKSVSGGVLVQDRDSVNVEDLDLKVVTKIQPTDAQVADMLFAFQVAKHVKSNAIVYAKNKMTVGIGAGQMSRLDSSRIAARKAEDAADAAKISELLTKGSAVASDAFFPFADGLISAVEAGATCAIQPGGSMRDDEVIAAADEAGIAMVFTGTRHFRH